MLHGSVPVDYCSSSVLRPLGTTKIFITGLLLRSLVVLRLTSTSYSFCVNAARSATEAVSTIIPLSRVPRTDFTQIFDFPGSTVS